MEGNGITSKKIQEHVKSSEKPWPASRFVMGQWGDSADHCTNEEYSSVKIVLKKCYYRKKNTQFNTQISAHSGVS